MPKTFKVNLVMANFPFLLSQAPRSTAIPSPEDGIQSLVQAYVGRMANTVMHTAAPIAMENVLPTVDGLASFGYNPTNGADSRIAQSGGAVFLWALDKTIAKPIQTEGLTATTAHVTGGWYAFTPSFGLWNMETGVKLAPQGIQEHLLAGIVQCNNHLVAYDRDTIYLSSQANAVDFTPDLGTGACSMKPQALTGYIVICIPISGGFIIFSSREAILATYKDVGMLSFHLIEGCGGISHSYNVTQYDNSGVIYAYTNSGLVAIDNEKCTPVFPQADEFLRNGVYEELNSGGVVSDVSPKWARETQQFPINQDLVNQHIADLDVSPTCIGNRYVCLSYKAKRTAYFTYALVYDIALGRWGRLKINHIAIGGTIDTLWFVTPDYTVTEGSIHYPATATLVIGKIAHTRDKSVTLHTVELEYLKGGSELHTLDIYASRESKTLIPVGAGVKMISDGNMSKWNMRAAGKNVSVRLRGSFNLTHMSVTIVSGGTR